MRITKAKAKDTQEIKDFVKMNLEEVFNSKAVGLEDLDNIKKNFDIFLIARDDEKIIGTIGVKNEGDARISRMYIHKEFRGKSIGKSLINEALKYCKGKFKRIFLTTYDKMNSEGFYNKMGFKTFKIKKEIKINKIWMDMELK
jgi:N-acetylglutamate synthase-like GNAT family acetyltransferase